MKHSLIVLAMLAACGFAQAQSTSNSNAAATSSPNVTSGNSASDSAANASANPNNANQQFIQLNTLTPETQTINQNQNVHYSGTQTVKNVPGIAMSGPASGPCTGMSGGVGVAGPGFGVGLNGSTVDKGCTVRENTRTAGQVYQALDSNDPMKAEAKQALMEGLAVIRQMNATIAADVAKDAPKVEPVKKAEAAPVAPAAAPAKVASATPAPAATPAYTGNDPFVKARLGMK